MSLFDAFGDDSGGPLDGLDGVPNAGGRPPGPPQYVAPPKPVVQWQIAPPVYEPAWLPEEPPNEDQEIENRLYKASMYRDLIQTPQFDAGDDVSREVEEECRQFFRKRLAETMAGVTSSGKSTLLTDDRLSVLVLMADAVLRQPKLQQALGITPAEVAKVTESERPKQRPQVRQNSRMPSQPRIAQPAPLQRPRPPAVQPQQQPQQPVRPPRPIQRLPQAPPPAQASEPQEIPAHDSIVQVNNRTFKIRHVEMRSDEYGPTVQGKLEKLDSGASVYLPNHKFQVYRDGDSFFKVLRLDLTPQTRNPESIPMPSVAGMAAISAMQAGEAVQSMDSKVQGLATISTNQ